MTFVGFSAFFFSVRSFRGGLRALVDLIEDGYRGSDKDDSRHDNRRFPMPSQLLATRSVRIIRRESEQPILGESEGRSEDPENVLEDEHRVGFALPG